MNWNRIEKVAIGTVGAALFGFFFLALINPLYWEFLAMTDAKFGLHLGQTFKSGALLAMSISGTTGFISWIRMTKPECKSPEQSSD
jgi:hypothetical protein